jgi:hypothetical protein
MGMSDKAILVEQGILEGEPIVAVSYLEPEDSWDSGYAAWCCPPDSVGDSVPVHVRCFCDEHPEAGRGMELARKQSAAIYDRNEWISS